MNLSGKLSRMRFGSAADLLGRGGEVDQGDAELGAFSTPQMRGRLDEGHFECGSDKSFEEMPAPGRTIAQAEHDVNVQSGFATIVDSDVTDRTQHLALLGDRNFAIRFVGEIEPADCRLGECTKCSQRCGPYLLLSGKRRDDRRGLFSRI